MPDTQSLDVARRAILIYEQRLKPELDPIHRDEFVAIEPESGDYFLGQTLSEAIGSARKAHPNRLAHALRVSHRTAVHFGTSVR
jgi:hypothetical protein